MIFKFTRDFLVKLENPSDWSTEVSRYIENEGYNRFDGTISSYISNEDMSYNYKYMPGPRDILFKRFREDGLRLPLGRKEFL